MGGSCSSQLEACKARVKELEEKLKLHESGTTSNEMKSSQTNQGLVIFGVDCECNSIWGILEILATIVVCILVMYIGYHCLIAYCNRRDRAKELKRRNFMELVDQRLQTQGDQQII